MSIVMYLYVTWEMVNHFVLKDVKIKLKDAAGLEVNEDGSILVRNK